MFGANTVFRLFPEPDIESYRFIRRHSAALILATLLSSIAAVAQQTTGGALHPNVTSPGQLVITSISICSPTGKGGAGSCPSGAFDTLQTVLGPNGGSVNNSNLGVGPVPDEHSSVFSPGTMGSNADHLFFLATPTQGNLGIGVAVLSGGAGPNNQGQWTLDVPRTDGSGSFASGFGQVSVSYTHLQVYFDLCCAIDGGGDRVFREPERSHR